MTAADLRRPPTVAAALLCLAIVLAGAEASAQPRVEADALTAAADLRAGEVDASLADEPLRSWLAGLLPGSVDAERFASLAGLARAVPGACGADAGPVREPPTTGADVPAADFTDTTPEIPPVDGGLEHRYYHSAFGRLAGREEWNEGAGASLGRRERLVDARPPRQ